MPRSSRPFCPGRRRAALALLGAAATPLAGRATPAPYPSRPVTLVVPFPPGGPADAVVRAIAEPLGQRLGQPVIVDFKGGAAGIIACDSVARAAPDGHTLLAATSDMLVNNSALFRQLPYDPLRDFTVVTQVGSMPLVLAVNASIAAQDLAALARVAQQQRGRLSYGSWGQGTHAHLAAEWLFNHRLGADAVHTPYRGLAPLTQDLAAQRISAAFGVVPGFAPLVGNRTLKVLAVTGSRRVAAFPDTATFAEQGHADDIFQQRLWLALVAPAPTPAPVVQRLHREMVPIVHGAQVHERLANAGFEALANNP